MDLTEEEVDDNGEDPEENVVNDRIVGAFAFVRHSRWLAACLLVDVRVSDYA